jgi:hypothetical protein
MLWRFFGGVCIGFATSCIGIFERIGTEHCYQFTIDDILQCRANESACLFNGSLDWKHEFFSSLDSQPTNEPRSTKAVVRWLVCVYHKISSRTPHSCTARQAALHIPCRSARLSRALALHLTTISSPLRPTSACSTLQIFPPHLNDLTPQHRNGRNLRRSRQRSRPGVAFDAAYG